MHSKVKVRLGRYLGFEIQSPKETQSVSELKAHIRHLEQALRQKEHHIAALLQGYVYIRDMSGQVFRLYHDNTVMDENGQRITVDWTQGEAMLPNGVVTEFRTRIDGSLQKWAADESGSLVQIQ